MLVECLVILLLVMLLVRRWKKRHVYELGKRLQSGVLSLPLIGHSYLFTNDEARMKALQTLGKNALSKDNGMTSMWLGDYLYTMIAEPEAAEFVLKTCLEKDDVMKMATQYIGNGSIFAPVSIWRPRRKLLMPNFSTKNMKNFLKVFNKQSRVLTEQLDKVADTGILSVWNYYTAYTMDSIAETSLGYEFHSQKHSAHPFLLAFDVGLNEVAKRLVSPWLHSDLIYYNLPVYKRLSKMKDYMWSFIKELLETKREELRLEEINGKVFDKGTSGERVKSLLELLIISSGGDEGYTDIEVIEETMVMMVAGNDTSAVGLSFISLMLAKHPEVQDKVYNELQEVFGDSDRSISWEDLPRLKYLDAVIRETLRLYTPVPIITRKIDKDVTLPSGLKLVAGSGVIVNIWALHRNPRYWGEDAEQFRPERFMDSSLRHPAAFMPFSNGPRNCVGYQFAMTSMKTVMSSVLRQFKIMPASDGQHATNPQLRLKFDLMMKDVDGYQIRLERRIEK